MMQRPAKGDASEETRRHDSVPDRRLDAALEETFPASDPPAILGDVNREQER